MQRMSPEQREWYFRRGSMIHKASILIDNGTLDWTALDERIVPYCRAYEKFRTELNPTVLKSEHEIRGHGWVGHLDRIYMLGGKRVLCDIKTNEVDEATGVQTAAYSRGVRGYVLRMGLALKDNGDYKVTWFERDARDIAGWESALGVAQWKIQAGLVKAADTAESEQE